MNKEKNLFSDKLVSTIYNKLLDRYKDENWKLNFVIDSIEYLRDNDVSREKKLKELISTIIYETSRTHKHRRDFIHEWADWHVSTFLFTTELFEVYSKDERYYKYINEARKEFGQNEDIIKDLKLGIYKALFEFCDFVLKEYNKINE